MKRLLALTLILISFNLFSESNITPRELILKTRNPVHFENTTFDSRTLNNFFDNYRPRSIRKLFPKDDRYFCIRFHEELDWNDLNKIAGNIKEIEYIQPNYINKMHFYPNDPRFESQFLELVNAEQAWDISTGSNNLIIAIIDSGCHFEHEDLQTNILINAREIPDNGIDDDNNGYIDDWRGWDFSDAPELSEIALGDYLDQDNDAEDENNHGTHVAGIIAADSDNSIGITGICHNASMLVVRAGFRTTQGTGYLQDDDCASAIVYAANMGASLINISWGDQTFSQVISDACQYAFDNGSIIVASAGNDPQPGVSYPARLGTTICVGAVDEDKNLGGFSSYGPEIDVVAPGSEILSTYSVDDPLLKYNVMSGTSMAAPFVTGALGLLLSESPELTFEEVKSRLYLSSEDLGTTGFDNYFGMGLLDIHALLSITSTPVVEITSPDERTGYSESFDIVGTVDAENFFRYSVMYTSSEMPEQIDWRNVEDHETTPIFYTENVIDDVLATFNLRNEVSDNTYLIKVELTTSDYKKYTTLRTVYLDQTAPVIDTNYLKIYKRYNEETPKYYLQSKYNEPVYQRIVIVDSQNNAFTVYNDHPDSTLIVHIPDEVAEGSIDMLISAENLCGISNVPHTFESIGNIDRTTINTTDFYQVPVGTAITGINTSNPYTIIGMEAGSGYGDVHVYDISTGEMQIVHTFDGQFWPLSVGSTNSSKDELIGINLDKIVVLESHDRQDFTLPVDTLLTKEDVMGARFANFDTDVYDEIITVENESSARVIRGYDRNGSYFINRFTLYNKSPTDTRNSFSTRLICGDFDDDGVTDIVGSDSDGDIMLWNINYDYTTNLIWSYRLPTPNAFFITKGDFTGDGVEEFCVGGYTESSGSPEKTYSFFQIFKAVDFHTYEPIEYISFDHIGSQNSITSVDFDGDEDDELIISVSPGLYIIDYIDGEFVPVWKGESDKTYQNFAIESTTSEQAKVFSNNTSGSQYRCNMITKSAEEDRPLPPNQFTATPINERSALLTWEQPLSGEVIVYKKENETMIELARVNGDSYIDTLVTAGNEYQYALAVYDESYSIFSSKLSLWKTVMPDYRAQLIDATFTSKNRLCLEFSRPLSNSALNIGNYYVSPDIKLPSSCVFDTYKTRIVLTFNKNFEIDKTYQLSVTNLRGDTDVPADDINMPVTLLGSELIKPFVEGINLIDRTHLEVVFSEYVTEVTATDKNNYSITYPEVDKNNGISSIVYADDRVTIVFYNELEYANKVYDLNVMNVEDIDGNKVKQGNKFLFSLTAIDNLDHVKIVPNPLYTSKSERFVIHNLPLNKSGSIRLYDISGDLVINKSIEGLTQNESKFEFLPRNKMGQNLSSGVYYYILEMGGDTKKGKLAVIR